MTALAVLNPAALVTLADCEQRIERGLKTFIDVGQALAEIRDSRLYKGSHGTFEEYLERRWQMSRSYAHRMIAAAEVALPMGNIEAPPTNERQTRELAKVPEAERAEVWREAVERTAGKPTAAAIREVQEERTRPAPTPGPTDVPSTAPAGPGPSPAPAADAVPSAPDPGLAQQVWDVLDAHGNRPYGITVGQIWVKLPGVHSADVRDALAELSADRRAVVMSHAEGHAPIEDRARWLNVRLTEPAAAPTESAEGQALRADLLRESERRTAVASIRSVLTYLTSRVLQPAELARDYLLALDEFSAADLRFAAETMAALAALKEQ